MASTDQKDVLCPLQVWVSQHVVHAAQNSVDKGFEEAQDSLGRDGDGRACISTSLLYGLAVAALQLCGREGGGRAVLRSQG